MNPKTPYQKMRENRIRTALLKKRAEVVRNTFPNARFGMLTEAHVEWVRTGALPR